MKFEIKDRWNGKTIYTADCKTLAECVVGAVASGADLSRANLYEANLFRANLSGADLSRANLYEANLYEANLFRANLSGADLSGADLSRADLSRADLSRADLSGANLSGANLSGANLSGANLEEIKNAALSLAQTRITPQEGAFVGWKKLQDGVIAKLVIPHDADRVNCAGSRKCRAARVFVHEMYLGNEVFPGIGIGTHDGKTQYITGKETLPDSFDPSITVECSHGIHFFLTREEAEAY
jgi:Family of unknown function (DUF5758)/Pentapeptide repeats (8 copies)